MTFPRPKEFFCFPWLYQNWNINFKFHGFPWPGEPCIKFSLWSLQKLISRQGHHSIQIILLPYNKLFWSHLITNWTKLKLERLDKTHQKLRVWMTFCCFCVSEYGGFWFAWGLTFLLPYPRKTFCLPIEDKISISLFKCDA